MEIKGRMKRLQTSVTSPLRRVDPFDFDRNAYRHSGADGLCVRSDTAG